MPLKLVRRFVALSLPLLLAAVPLGIVIRVGRAAPAAAAYFVTVNGGAGTCDQNSPCELQTALSLAGTGATIFVEQGTYTGVGTAVVTVNHSIKLIGGWSGNPVGFPLINPAVYTTTIDGQGSRRGLYVSSGLTPTIAGFVVTHGNATGLAVGCLAVFAMGCGGGMFVDSAAADIENNTFIDNTALVTATSYSGGDGGGLYLEAASGSVISHNVFLSNTAALDVVNLLGQGGGLALHNSNINTVVDNNQFIGNIGSRWGGGLALNNTNNVQVQGNLFRSNLAVLGGGLFTLNCSAVVIGNVFRGNTGDAPAHLGYFSGPFGANLLVDNPTGAGVLVAYGTGGVAIVFNNIVAHSGSVGLKATAFAAGPLNMDAIYNTVVGPGAGTGLLIGTDYVTATAINTLISGFSTGVTNASVAGSTVTADHTLFDTNVLSTGNAVFTHNVFGPAAFVNPAQRDYHILANSAARDAGTPVFLIGTDFDGDHRPIGPQVDIGADETNFVDAIFLPITRR